MSIPCPHNVRYRVRGIFLLCPRISVWSAQRTHIAVCCKMYVRTCAKWKSNNSQVANHSHNKDQWFPIRRDESQRFIESPSQENDIRHGDTTNPQILLGDSSDSSWGVAKWCDVSAGASRMTALCRVRICGLGGVKWNAGQNGALAFNRQSRSKE